MFGAELHVVSTAPSRQRDPIHEAVRDMRGTGPEDITYIDPSDADSLIDALRHRIDKMDADLIITGPTGEPVAMPPLSDPISEGLVEQLDRPLHIGTQERKGESIRRILVPSDRSESSLNALQHAVRLAGVLEAEVVLLHVVEQSPYVALTPTDRLSLSGPTLPERQARRRLTAMIETAHQADVSVRPQLEFGDPVRQIGRLVGQEEVDLVVLSSHGTTAQPRRSLGSVARKTLRRVAAPVFLTRTFGRSLLPDEGTEA